MNLIAAAIIGIAVIVLLIAACKVHPFLSLLAGSFVMAVCAGVPFDKAFDSFTSGVGGTISNVGLLIAFGSIIGTILFKSGGADTIVDTIMAKTPLQRLPWAMALIAFIVGIPMFFEVGVVILIPVVLFAARRSKSPVVLLGIPALAGLSTLHAFVPPHPGPLTAIGAMFDAWYRDWKTSTYISIRLFEDYIHLLMGSPAGTCSTTGTCGAYMVVEGSGAVYPCDFFCLDAYKLGTVQNDTLQ